MSNPYVIVTGCGRSGTSWTMNALCSLGLDVKHERPGRDGMVDWYSVDPEHRRRLYGESGTRREGIVILHQVRHPVLVIASTPTLHDWCWPRACRLIGNLSRDPILRGMRYWLEWNRRAEMYADFPPHRVEDLCASDGWRTLLERIGEDDRPRPDIPTNVNTRSHSLLTWNDLEHTDARMTQDIRDMARGYGYYD